MQPEQAKLVLLSYINDAREACGLDRLTELRPGIPAQCSACLVAENLQVETDEQAIYTGNERVAESIAEAWSSSVEGPGRGGWLRRNWKVELPEPVKHAAAMFDANQIPELIAVGEAFTRLHRRDLEDLELV